MTQPGGITNNQIQSIVDRIERLDGEIADLNADKSEVFKEAKGNGFDVTALKLVIAERRKIAKDKQGFESLSAVADLYRAALGTPIATRAGAR